MYCGVFSCFLKNNGLLNNFYLLFCVFFYFCFYCWLWWRCNYLWHLFKVYFVRSDKGHLQRKNIFSVHRTHLSPEGNEINILRGEVGWGTWIRTTAAGVRIQSSTTKLSPSKGITLFTTSLSLRRLVLLPYSFCFW